MTIFKRISYPVPLYLFNDDFSLVM